jgi:hypothetical protein
LLAVAEMSRALTPSPIDIETASESLTPIFGCWAKFADDGTLADRLSAGWRQRVADLAVLEAGWQEAVAGNTLLHLDTRADNVLLTPERVYIVDWPWAATGAAWVDVAVMLPSVAMQGGPDPEELWRAHPLSRGVDNERVDAFLAALAGMFLWSGMQPPPPGLPTLRRFQTAQGDRALAWLAKRRAWS